MKKNIYKIVMFIILFIIIQIKYVNAEIGVESSQASLMTKEYKENITKTTVSLTDDLKYAEESKIHSDSANLYTNNNSNKKNITICVNAGHGTSGGESVRTKCHPDGTAKVTGGSTAEGSTTATAVASGMTFTNGTEERVVTLSMALIFKDVLLANGYNVLMIREVDDVQLDNIARTVLANSYANCHIALHWDDTTSDKGAYYMKVPSVDSYKAMEPVSFTWEKSDALGEALIDGLDSQGVKIFGDRHVEQDLTQTSYSSVPSIDIELGDRVSDTSEENLIKIAAGLLKGVSDYYDKNDITYPNGGNGASNGKSKDKDSLISKGLEKLKQDMLEFLDFLLGCIDVIQTISNLFVTAEIGTIKDATVLYSTSQIQSNQKINNYINYKEGYNEKSDYPIDGTEEGYSSTTQIPFTPVDIYTIASGSVSNFDINFFTGQNNIEEHPSDSLWMALRKIVSAAIHISIYFSAAFLLIALIWHGINVVLNSIMPERKAKHIGGIEDFAKAVLMLVGSVVIMVLCIFLANKLVGYLGLKKTIEFPYTVSVKSVNYTFSTNLTGYVRYLSQITNFDKLGTKFLYFIGYFVLAIANLLITGAMIIRMAWIVFLSIIGPIIAAAYAVQFKSVLGLEYKDWIIKYIKWSGLQVFIALGYTILMKIF